MKKIITTALLVMAIFATATYAQEEHEKYIVGLPMPAGMEKSSIAGLLKDIVAYVGELLGEDTEAKVLVYEYGTDVAKFVEEKMESGEVDVSYLLGNEYAAYLDSGKNNLTPFFTLSMSGQSIMPTCLFAAKGKYKSVEDLRGLRWGGVYTQPTRYLLYKAGIDEPLDKFFSEVKFVSDMPVTGQIEGFDNGDYDVFNTYDVTLRVAGYMNKKDISFEPVSCVDYNYSWIFLYRDGLDEKVMEEFRDLMIGADKDKRFAKFHFAFKMIQGRFGPIDYDELDKVVDIYKLGKKHGWDKEEKKYFKEQSKMKAGHKKSGDS